MLENLSNDLIFSCLSTSSRGLVSPLVSCISISGGKDFGDHESIVNFEKILNYFYETFICNKGVEDILACDIFEEKAITLGRIKMEETLNNQVSVQNLRDLNSYLSLKNEDLENRLKNFYISVYLPDTGTLSYMFFNCPKLFNLLK